MRSGNGEKGRLFFLVGLAHSGKSTVANSWLVEARVPRPRVVIGGDDFRQAVYGKEYDPDREGLVFAAMDTAIRALLYRGFDVLVDETCTTESTLLRYLKLDLDAIALFVDTDVDTCIERAIRNGREYLITPIRRMDSQLKRLREGWDETVNRLRQYIIDRRGLDRVIT